VEYLKSHFDEDVNLTCSSNNTRHSYLLFAEGAKRTISRGLWYFSAVVSVSGLSKRLSKKSSPNGLRVA
jgi:hypothetical protein